MSLTKEQFRDACAYLAENGGLTVSGERYIDAHNLKIWDDSHDPKTKVRTHHVDITPNEATLQQALIDLASQQATEQAQVTEDNDAFSDLLTIANAGLTQIANDLTALDTATTIASIKPIVQNALNRQDKMLRVMRGIIRRKS